MRRREDLREGRCEEEGGVREGVVRRRGDLREGRCEEEGGFEGGEM